MIRDSKAGHPVADKGVGDGLYVGAVQREGNQLVRRAVHYCEEVVVALLGPWEVAHHTVKTGLFSMSVPQTVPLQIPDMLI